MMSRLLARVDVGGSVHLGELADELGVTVTVVRDMLRDLALRGYLKPTGGECSTKCGGCVFSTSCHGATTQQTWTLTEKGRRAATGAA
jgi:predicted ArsR family transcriptional regulator